MFRYPSLLESSDADGGSAVAVLTYLRRILDALDHPELVQMILRYLLALPDYPSSSSRTSSLPTAAKKRQSLMLLSAPGKDEDRPNPSLFNLVDLILGSTDSRNPQTVVAALKLSTVILSKNHGYALGSLVKVINSHYKEPYRTVGALNVELETYLTLAVGLAGEDGVDESYESHLKDALSMLENHPCSLKNIALQSATSAKTAYTEANAKEVGQHYLIPEDPLFRSLSDLLLRFLTNDVDTNLALTEAIVNLGTCSQLRLEGWLSVNPADYHFEDSGLELEEVSNETFKEMYMASRLPTWEASADPQLLVCIQQLHTQVEALRSDIPDWDEHIANRKNAFRFHEEMHEAMKTSAVLPKPSQPPSEAGSGNWTPQIPKHVAENSTTPSRNQSPRGRKETLSEHRQSQTSSPAPSVEKPLPALPGGKRQTTLFSDIDANYAGLKHSELLKRRIQFRRAAQSQQVEVMLSKYHPPPKEPSDEGGDGEGQAADEVHEASLLHIMTNVVILQEFVLELVALMQVRASLFNEVKFT
jgi:hypothetical protein